MRFHFVCFDKLFFMLAILLSVSALGLPRHGWILARCSIFDSNKKLIRIYPGYMCDFLPDGRFVSFRHNHLIFYSSNNKRIWKIDGYFHHQLKFSEDRKSIMAIKADVEGPKDQQVRYDDLLLIGLDGKVKKRFSFFEHRDEILELAKASAIGPIPRQIFVTDSALPEVHWEFAHTNSFYEIPKNALEGKSSALKHGNYVINLVGERLILIVDHDLNEIVGSFPYANDYDGNQHDAQILPNGHLLIFNNGSYSQQRMYTSFDEIDLGSRKVVWQYKANPERTFHFDVGGGLGGLRIGDTLYSTDNGVIAEITRSGKLVWSMDFEFPKSDGDVFCLQTRSSLI